MIRAFLLFLPNWGLGVNGHYLRHGAVLMGPSRFAATSLPIEEVALLHAIHVGILTRLAAIVLTLGSIKPTTITFEMTGSTLLQLGMGAAENTSRQRRYEDND